MEAELRENPEGAGSGESAEGAAGVIEAPFYVPVGREIQVFEAAASRTLPIMLKGPTGCGKTRLVEHMAHKLGVTRPPTSVIMSAATPSASRIPDPSRTGKCAER